MTCSAWMEIASRNVNSPNVSLPPLAQRLADAGPDVAALHETKLQAFLRSYGLIA